MNIRFTWDVESTSWLTDLHETVCVRLWTAWLLLASLEPPPQYVRVLSANFVDDTSTCSQLSVNAWQFPIMPDVIQCTAMQLLFLARTSSVQAALMYRILEAVISSPDSMWPFASERRKCTSRLALQSDAHWRLANCTIGCLRSRILSPPVAWKGPASPSRGSAPAARPSPKRPAPITLTGEDLLASVVQHDLQASMQARKRLMVGGSASARIDHHGESERAASSPAAISSSPIASDEEQPAESADFETEEKPDGVPAGSVTGAATSRLQWYEARDKKSLSEWCERTESFMRTHGLRPDVGLAVLSLLCPQQDAASISKLSCPAIACLMDTSVSLLADALAARSSASSCLPASASPRIPAVFGVNRPAYFIVTFHHSSAPASVIPGVYEHINLPPPAPEPMQANATPDPVSIVRSWLATGAFKSLAFLVPGVMDVLESARSFPIASGSYRREQWEKAVRASQFEQRAAASLKRKMRSQQVEARRTVRFEARQRKTLAWVPAPISIGADDADAFADGDGAWSGSDAGSDAEADNPVILMHTLCVWEPLLVTLLTSLYNMLLVAQSVGLFEPAVVDLAAGCCAGAVHGPDAATLSLFETLAGLLKKSSFVGVSTALLDLLAVLCITPELQCAFAQLCVAALHLVNPVDCNGAGYIQTRAEAWYFPVFAPRQFAIGEYHVFPVRFLCIPWDQPFSLIRPALPPALDFSVLQQKAELSDVVASLLPDIKATIEKYSSLDWWWDWLCPHYVLRYDCDYGYLRYSLFGMAAWLPRQHHEHALVLLMAHVAHALNRRISNSGTTSVSAPPPRAGRAHSNKDGSSSDEYPFDDDICSDDDEDIDTDEEITRITRYPRSTFASSTPPVLTFWSALRSLTADSLQHYSEVLLCFAIAYLAGCEPGILRNDVRAGVIGSQEDLLSVDEVLAVQVPLQGSSEQLSLTDCVCVMMRRALSILRLCLPLVALTLSQPDTVAHRGARIARTLAVLASVLHAKTAHVLAWRSAPAAAGTERGPQIAPARLRKCFADISATALSVLAVVDSQMRGYAKLSNRTRSTLASIFQLQCGTQPAVSSSVAPATDLQTLPSGDALSSDDVWKRLLLLDPARIPAWHELLR